jgi:hypothetical protein
MITSWPDPGLISPKWTLKPCGEEDRGSGLEVRLDLALEDALLHVVGKEDGDELRALDRGRDGLHGQARFFGGRPRVAPEAQSDLDVHAGIAQVQRVRVPWLP